MEKGAVKILVADVMGAKKNLYGKAGDKVTIVSVFHNVVIVQNGKGEKFSCPLTIINK